VTARLRRELGIDVEMEHGRYGEFKVLVDGQLVVDGIAMGTMGFPPTSKKIVELVRAHLQNQEDAPAS
jgi:hypothetical protein